MSTPSTGRVTLPIQDDLTVPVSDVIDAFGADAVRNSDGTWLPDDVADLGIDVYETYFPGRGDQEWARDHVDMCPQIFLTSARTPALADGPLDIDLMGGYLADQIRPNTTCERAKYWQVIDRTTGETLEPEGWRLIDGDTPIVRVDNACDGHVYQATFLAYQQWDPTQMYNYITNNWDEDPTRYKEIPYDIRHEAVWERAQERFAQWLEDHPDVTVVRFTTFFYHFTLVFNAERREQFVDWFGYTASVSPEAIEAFEAETGLSVTPEDFVQAGTHASSFVPPTPVFAAWIDFQSRFVRSRIAILTQMAHDAGKRAFMFLGDNWIGTEPYVPGFGECGIDGVAGSVGNAATCRMISDIPEVEVHEGRFLPYFFPDVFCAGGDPLGEANESWIAARRAILRRPLERIGYGGYLSLALEHPEFIARAQEICDEFRLLYDALGGKPAESAPVRVGVLNAWGAMRTWQTHMVAHALPYSFTDPYVGVLEALAGMRYDVTFLNFDDVRAGALDDLDVVINCGSAGDAFSGGEAWADPAISGALRRFVHAGGGLVGVGDPTAHPLGGAYFQLSDVFGVDRERGFTLSTDRYARSSEEHFLLADGPIDPEGLKGVGHVAAIASDVVVLAGSPDKVGVSVREIGNGRAVYIAGLPYAARHTRLLDRALMWAASSESKWDHVGVADDPTVDVATVDDGSRLIVCNSSMTPRESRIRFRGASKCVKLESAGFQILASTDLRDASEH